MDAYLLICQKLHMGLQEAGNEFIKSLLWNVPGCAVHGDFLEAKHRFVREHGVEL